MWGSNPVEIVTLEEYRRREEFARTAMNAITRAYPYQDAGTYLSDAKYLAKAAVAIADALIAELNKEPEESGEGGPNGIPQD